MWPLLKFGIRIIQRLHWLNLDIILGAIGLSICFQKGFNHPLSNAVLVGLGSAIGLIYTLDHLWDIRKMKGLDVHLSERRLFHQRSRFLLKVLATSFIIGGIGILSHLSWMMLEYGGLLLGGCGIYLYGAQKWSFLTKEPLVALGYTLGILFPFWLQLTPQEIETFHLGYWTIILYGIALSNLLIFSWFDYQLDQSSIQKSWATQWGITQCYWATWICLVSTWILLIWGGIEFEFFQMDDQLHLDLKFQTVSNGSPIFQEQSLWQTGLWGGGMMMLVLLTLLFYYPHWSRINERYRWIGDGVFLISWLLLIWI